MAPTLSTPPPRRQRPVSRAEVIVGNLITSVAVILTAVYLAVNL